MTYADALREAGRHAAAAEQLRSAVEHLAAAKGDAAAQVRARTRPVKLWFLRLPARSERSESTPVYNTMLNRS